MGALSQMPGLPDEPLSEVSDAMSERQVYATNDAFEYLLTSEQGTRVGNQLLHDWLKVLQAE